MKEFEMVERMEMTRLKEPVMVGNLELKTLKVSSTAGLMAALILTDAQMVVSSGWLIPTDSEKVGLMVEH